MQTTCTDTCIISKNFNREHKEKNFILNCQKIFYKLFFCELKYYLLLCFFKIKNMEVKQLDVRDEILAHLKEDDRNLAWLSKKTGIKYSTLYTIFVHKIVRLSREHTEKINTLLKTEFKPQERA